MSDEESKRRFSEALEDLLLEEDIEISEIKDEESDFENDFQNDQKDNFDILIKHELLDISECQATANGTNDSKSNEIIWKPGTSTEAECNPIPHRITSRLPPNIVINSKVDAFYQFMSDEILDLILQHTNQRGIYIQEQDPNIQWTPVDKIELSAFLGLLIFHGVMKGKGKPFPEFWSQEFGFPIFTATMTHKRMLDIIRCLRFDNMDTRVARRVDSGDKAEAVREFLDLFSQRCRASLVCSSDVVIGERVCCRKLNPASQVHSQHSQMEIFYAVDGYNDYITSLEIPTSEKTREELVLSLTEHLFGSGRNIITNPCYTSYSLSQELKQRNLKLTGSLQKNHEDLPSEFLFPQPKPMSCHVGETSLISYATSKTDSKVILSTLKFDETEEAIAFYDENIDSIHRLERMIDKYTVKRNSRRWPLAVFYNIVDFAALNAFAIYKHVDTCLERRRFLLDLAKGLAEAHISRRLLTANEKIYNAVTIIGLKHLFSKNSIKEELLEERKVKQMATRKRGRCFNCPRSMDRKSKEKCDKCFAFVCSDHRGILCVMCLGDKNRDENQDD